MPSINSKNAKVTVDATITGVNDDGVNYSIDILVNYGGLIQGFNIQVPIATFTTEKDYKTWLTNWVTTNKASFIPPNSDSLFVGISVSGV